MCANTSLRKANSREVARMAIGDERVSRRRLLKRAGVGAAVIGAGSMVTAGTASAVGFCHDCSCSPCGSGNGCGHWFGHGVCTACVPTTEGCCFCHEGIACDGATGCANSGDCPPGWACAATCCGGLICVPPAGDPAGTLRRRCRSKRCCDVGGRLGRARRPPPGSSRSWPRARLVDRSFTYYERASSEALSASGRIPQVRYRQIACLVR